MRWGKELMVDCEKVGFGVWREKDKERGRRSASEDQI